MEPGKYSFRAFATNATSTGYGPLQKFIAVTYTWTEDTEAPVITTTATSGDLGYNPTVVAPVFTGTDNCEGTITPVVTTE